MHSEICEDEIAGLTVFLLWAVDFRIWTIDE
jgi:hypothetical protein